MTMSARSSTVAQFKLPETRPLVDADYILGETVSQPVYISTSSPGKSAFFRCPQTATRQATMRQVRMYQRGHRLHLIARAC